MAGTPKLVGNGFYLTAEMIAEVLGYVPGNPTADLNDATAAPVDAVAATNSLTSDNTNVTAGDTVTIGTKVYTFVSPVGSTEGNVLRGASADASLTNLVRAILHTGTPNTDYKCALPHPDVSSAAVASHALALSALVNGVAGNAIALATDAVTLTVGGALFTGGIDGTPGSRRDLILTDDDELYICIADADETTAGAWKQIELTAL